MKIDNIIECHDCGLFLEKNTHNLDKKYFCPRCDSKLSYSKRHNLESLYYAITSLMLFVILNIYPLLSVNMSARIFEANLYSTFIILLKENFFFVASVVFFTIFLAPVLNSCIIIISFIQSNTKMSIFSETLLHDSFHFLKSCSFIEVLILSIIVSYIKLVPMSSYVYFDIGFYVLIFYLFCFYMSIIRFEDKDVLEE